MVGKIHRLIWLLILLFPQVHQISWGGNGISFENFYALNHADSLYNSGNYAPALESYTPLLNTHPIKRNTDIHFRAAYAAYKSGKYEFSAAAFLKLSKQENFLPEYTYYFYLQSLWKTNSGEAAKLSQTYIKKYSRHAFADSLIPTLADYFFETSAYSSAQKYYTLAKTSQVNPKNNVDFLIKAAVSQYLSGERRAALKSYLKILKKYPSNNSTLKLADRIRVDHAVSVASNLFDVVNVYLSNKKFHTARRMLEDYLKTKPKQSQIEKARFWLVKIYYGQQKYRTALYGFKDLLANLSDKSLEADLRIYIARTHRKLGHTQKAIDLYLDFAERFPNRRLAPEAMWTAGWLSEGMGNTKAAISLYHQVYAKWQRSFYAKEAHFREGFILYDQKRFEEADQVFTHLCSRNWNDSHLNRARYWSALSKEAMGDTLAASKLRRYLAQNLWDDYYTMRSYLWELSDNNSQPNVSAQQKTEENPLLDYGDGLAQILKKTEAAFQMRSLLGDAYGKIVLSDIKLALKNSEEWIALAEIYKKFDDYGRAFEIYDYINRKYFSHISFVEKVFMLKERFPYYYDTIIEKFSVEYGIEKEFILAVIKQESRYKPDARSAADAHGLMQLIPPTAKEMASLAGKKLRSIDELYNPEYNIQLGSLYLKRLNRQFKGRKEHILAAYNAGPSRVNRWKKKVGAHDMDVFIEKIEFSETRDYVRRVLKNYWAYKLLGDNLSSEEVLYGAVTSSR